MRFFISAPITRGIRVGAILCRRDLAMLFPMWLWRVPIYVAIAAVTYFGILFAAEFISYLPAEAKANQLTLELEDQAIKTCNDEAKDAGDSVTFSRSGAFATAMMAFQDAKLPAVVIRQNDYACTYQIDGDAFVVRDDQGSD